MKVCGLTDASETRLAVELGADLIGLNFFPKSARYLEPERAAELVRAVEAGPGRKPTWVGVFVNEEIERAVHIAEEVGLDLLQFHGDETPEELAPLAERAIKALRVKGDVTPELIDPWRHLGLWGLLIDARHETLYGGSGRRWNVESLPAALGVDGSRDSQSRDDQFRAGQNLRVLVAGGLEPSNVAEAARRARPWGVDLCSGVESSPGRKDAELMRQLFAELGSEENSRSQYEDLQQNLRRDRQQAFSPNEELPHGQTSPAA